MKAIDRASAEDRDRTSRQQPVLPSIFDLFGDEVSAPLLPPSSLNCSQRPYALRSRSYPTLHVDPWVPRVDLCSTAFRGPKLRPMTSLKGESVPHVHQLESPSPTISSSTSVCSTDAKDCPGLKSLVGILDRPQLDYDAVVRFVTEVLEDSCVPPAFTQGWFQPDNIYNHRLEGELAGLSLNELADAFFFRDESRALYGDRVIRPRRQAQPEPAVLKPPKPEEKLDPKSLEKLEKKKGDGKSHQKQEEARRDRHRDCQHDSHERCPEIAAKCGADHAREAKVTTRPQVGKGPGKDEQLYSSIYTQEMAGRLVQALNERRKRAEDMGQVLLQLLQQQRNLSISAPGSHQYHHKAPHRASFSQPIYVGVKRCRDDTEEEQQRTWTRIRHDSDGADSHSSSSTKSDSMWM